MIKIAEGQEDALTSLLSYILVKSGVKNIINYLDFCTLHVGLPDVSGISSLKAGADDDSGASLRSCLFSVEFCRCMFSSRCVRFNPFVPLWWLVVEVVAEVVVEVG